MIDLYQLKERGKLFNDRYELQEPIGRGGFASVWRVRDTKSRLDVVLKVYDGVDEEGEGLFRSEFAMVHSLNHTNILTPDYYDVCDGTPYIVMTLCEKGSATKLIGKASESQVWDFISQVAAGLACIHKHDIIHKDIKPANILINGEGQYMISDFGISTRLRNTMRRSERENTGSGTIAYMPYEALKKNPVDSFSRDIWAFGASVYEIMTGEVPFGDYGGITQNGEHGKVPEIRDDRYSDKLKQLVYKCLAFETKDRPSAGEILEMLSSPSSAPRHRRRLVAAATATVVAVLSGVAVLIHGHEPPNPYDSIVISTIGRANSIVAVERDKDEPDKRNATRLCQAAQMYREAMALPASDKAIREGKNLWTSSQYVIDDTYTSLDSMAAEYWSAGAGQAAEDISVKYEEIKDYVSDSVRQIRVEKTINEMPKAKRHYGKSDKTHLVRERSGELPTIEQTITNRYEKD